MTSDLNCTIVFLAGGLEAEAAVAVVPGIAVRRLYRTRFRPEHHQRLTLKDPEMEFFNGIFSRGFGPYKLESS